MPKITKMELWIKANEITAATYSTRFAAVFSVDEYTREIKIDENYAKMARLMYEFLLDGVPK